MRSGFVILSLGLVAGALAYGCFYLLGTSTARDLLEHGRPELAWLRHEFDLSEAEYQRIERLHAEHLPRCIERCAQIETLNTQLWTALSEASQLTPQMQSFLSERARIRAACQAEMIDHFLAVSRTMAPAQGTRYLAWVWENTCLREQAMAHDMADSGDDAMTLDAP